MHGPRAEGLCEIWGATQLIARAQAVAAQVAGLPPEKVIVHNYILGGGFGRRLEVDFMAQAVAIGKQVDGPGQDRLDARGRRPARHVSTLFLRPPRRRSGRWRPAGCLEPSHLRLFHHRPLGAPRLQGRLRLRHGRRRQGPLYGFPNVRLDYVRNEPPGIPTAFWRSVGPSHNVFVVESFIDELAAAAKADPVAYRRALMGKFPRAQAVLDLAAEKAGWGTKLPERTGRGVAVQDVFGSYMAQVAEVAVSKDGDVAVKRIVCAVDTGIVINPNTVEAQVQSAIVYGLSAALWGEITLKDGRVEQSNFNNYRALRINEMPEIEVHIVRNGEAPGGMGEPGTCALPPAVTNAIFAATGVRLRKLPIDTSKLKV